MTTTAAMPDEPAHDPILAAAGVNQAEAELGEATAALLNAVTPLVEKLTLAFYRDPDGSLAFEAWMTATNGESFGAKAPTLFEMAGQLYDHAHGRIPRAEFYLSEYRRPR